MNKFTIKFLSAITGVITFLTLDVLFILTSKHINDLIASVFWFGSVGIVVSFIYGIGVSYFIGWLLKKIQSKDGVKYQILFITLHFVFGTIIPILGNIVAIFFSIAHLLLEKGKKKQLLFFLLCAVIFITSGIILELQFDFSLNMKFHDMIWFFVLFLVGSFSIGIFNLFFLKQWRLIVTVVSICLVFLPTFIHILNANEDFQSNYESNLELAKLYDGVEENFPHLELDLMRSFENGYTLDLSIKNHSKEFSVESIKSFIDYLPKRSEGYYLNIYGDIEFLRITIDSYNNVIECEHENTQNSICGKL